jgi:hypothetical protein
VARGANPVGAKPHAGRRARRQVSDDASYLWPSAISSGVPIKAWSWSKSSLARSGMRCAKRASELVPYEHKFYAKGAKEVEENIRNWK